MQEAVVQLLTTNKGGLTSKEMRLRGLQINRRVLRLLERQDRISKEKQKGSPMEYRYKLV